MYALSNDMVGGALAGYFMYKSALCHFERRDRWPQQFSRHVLHAPINLFGSCIARRE